MATLMTDPPSTDVVTSEELAAVETLAAEADAPTVESVVARGRLEALGLSLLPRIVRVHRRVCDERDSGLLTDDLVAPAVAKAEAAAHAKGRREAIEKACKVAREWCDERDASGMADQLKAWLARGSQS